MIRGTTPTHAFEIPFDTSLIDSLSITYAQNDAVILTKDKFDCELDGRFISTKLTQAETLLFNHKQIVQVQLRVVMTDGTALASEVFWMSAGQCLEGSEL